MGAVGCVAARNGSYLCIVVPGGKVGVFITVDAGGGTAISVFRVAAILEREHCCLSRSGDEPFGGRDFVVL